MCALNLSIICCIVLIIILSIIFEGYASPILKADRPHPRDYPQTTTDYRRTDNHFRLVRALMDGWTDGKTDGRTDRCYQAHYLPALLSYAVDNQYTVMT